MGTIVLILIGLPITGLVWFGAAWVITYLWSKIKLNIAVAKSSDEIAPHAVERAAETARRGY